MKSESVARVDEPGYRLEILASKNVCVVPWESQNLWQYAATLRITNTSAQPLTLRHHDGSVAGWALQARVMDPARQRQAELPSHPIGAAGVKKTSVVLPPGSSVDLRGDPAAYFLVPMALTRDGKDVERNDVGSDRRFRQDFAIDFTANVELEIAGTIKQVSKVLPTTLTVFVREKQ